MRKKYSVDLPIFRVDSVITGVTRNVIKIFQMKKKKIGVSVVTVEERRSERGTVFHALREFAVGFTDQAMETFDCFTRAKYGNVVFVMGSSGGLPY